MPRGWISKIDNEAKTLYDKGFQDHHRELRANTFLTFSHRKHVSRSWRLAIAIKELTSSLISVEDTLIELHMRGPFPISLEQF